MQARYTEYLYNLMNNPSVKEGLNKALSTYPLHTPKNVQDLIPTRDELNERILNHYKYREIGFETVGRFLDELEITMKEIMPYYNERFKTIEVMAEIENPFDTVDLVETFEQESFNSSSNQNEDSRTDSSETERSGTSNSSFDNTSNTKSIDSDTPGNSLSIGSKDIDSVNYASNANWSEGINSGSDEKSVNDTSKTDTSSSGSSSGSSESSGTVKHTFTKKGAQGVTTFGHDMIEFRDSIIDVMNEIVTDERLGELFMMVY